MPLRKLTARKMAALAAFFCAGVVGLFLLADGWAATYAVPKEAETATLGGRVMRMSYASASAGSTLKFGAVCYSPTASTDNARTGYNFFVSKGFDTKKTAGIIGNLMQESHMDPTIKQYGGGPGRGIAQWTVTERWQDLLRWKGTRNEWALQTQLDFMIHEMLTTEKRTVPAMMATKTINEATYTFERYYERAGTPNYTARYAYANDAYGKYSATVPPLGCGGSITGAQLASGAPQGGAVADPQPEPVKYPGESELIYRGLLAGQVDAIRIALASFAHEQQKSASSINFGEVRHDIEEQPGEVIIHHYGFDVTIDDATYAAKIELISDDTIRLQLFEADDAKTPVYDSGVMSGDSGD